MNPKKESRANPAATQDDNKLQEDHTIKTALQARFSMFNNSFDTEPARETTLEQLAADIRGGRWQAQVEQLRAMTLEQYGQNKRNLQAAAFGGTFTRRKKDALITPSRLVVIDIDHVEGQELAIIKARLTADQHTALCFVSPSGNGLKAVFVAEFADDATFKQAWRAIAAHFSETHGITLDATGKDICRLCYVSHDPGVYYNPDAVQFCYEVAAVEVEAKPEALPEKAARKAATKQEQAFIDSFYPAYHRQFIAGLLNAELENIDKADRGQGNTALNNAALKLAHYYNTGLFEKEEVKQTFRRAYLARAGSPKTEAEFNSTFESGFSAGLADQREMPDPKHSYGGGIFKLTPAGVFHIAFDKEGNETAPFWLCSPVYIKALTRDTNGREWGRLLAWPDRDGKLHEWAMPMELLQGDGNEVRAYLAAGGADISTNGKARNLFNSYLQLWPVQARARCTQRPGWHNGVYVMPDQVIGDDSEKIVFQNISPVEPAFSVSGSVEAWRDNVARLAEGNSRIVFAISAAFAAPLAALVNIEGGGFHFRGGSSTGKTTALIVASSVWGGSSFRREWRATGNGLEGVAAQHNDNLLTLDELSQLDPKEAGNAAYMLANGAGKIRSEKSGEAKPAKKFRVIFLSAGEENLSALMAKAEKRSNAGQELRMADIEAEAGSGMGMFENIHGMASPGTFAVEIKSNAEKYHGAAGVEFLRQVVKYRPVIAEKLVDGIRQFVEELNMPPQSAQAGRVARRFALVAAAGEAATALGLTGWPEGEADRAAKKCLSSWLANYGGHVSREETTVLQQVKAFFEAHESSRFEQLGGNDGQKVINRVGFWRYRGDNKEYLVLPEAFKNEICKGLDYRSALKILARRGWFEPGKEKPAQLVHLAGGADEGGKIITKRKVYIFNSTVWESEP